MEDNYSILPPTTVPADKEQEPAILFLDNRNFTGLMKSQPDQMVQIQGIRHEQQVYLVGKPYSAYDDFDYFLAISG